MRLIVDLLFLISFLCFPSSLLSTGKEARTGEIDSKLISPTAQSCLLKRQVDVTSLTDDFSSCDGRQWEKKIRNIPNIYLIRLRALRMYMLKPFKPKSYKHVFPNVYFFLLCVHRGVCRQYKWKEPESSVSFGV